MLAQNFKSAVDLGITDPQLSALQKTLVLLETGKLKHTPMRPWLPGVTKGVYSGEFNMGAYIDVHECGTIGCIAGTATLISGVDMHDPRPSALDDLFYARGDNSDLTLYDITPAQAATALRSYLTTGDARWDLAVA